MFRPVSLVREGGRRENIRERVGDNPEIEALGRAFCQL